MIAILCRSACLASEIEEMAGDEKTLAYAAIPEGVDAVSYVAWLEEALRNNAVSTVLYEPRFFVDPSVFRAISPKTRFIVLASPGEEDDTRSALMHGATAVISKPVTAQDVRGVLTLALQ